MPTAAESAQSSRPAACQSSPISWRRGSTFEVEACEHTQQPPPAGHGHRCRRIPPAASGSSVTHCRPTRATLAPMAWRVASSRHRLRRSHENKFTTGSDESTNKAPAQKELASRARLAPLPAAAGRLPSDRPSRAPAFCNCEGARRSAARPRRFPVAPVQLGTTRREPRDHDRVAWREASDCSIRVGIEAGSHRSRSISNSAPELTWGSVSTPKKRPVETNATSDDFAGSSVTSLP